MAGRPTFMKFALCGVRGLDFSGSGGWSGVPLPFALDEELALEDVSGAFRQGAFELMRERYGSAVVDQFEFLRFALVYRYPGPPGSVEAPLWRVAKAAACLRLIRPTRVGVTEVSGDVTDGGQLDPTHFAALPRHDVPRNQRLFDVRLEDAERLRVLWPRFLEAMGGEYWKFRMGVEFHERAHFHGGDWKIRLFLLAAALDAIFDPGGPATRVVRERIRCFLGSDTSVYPAGDLWRFDRAGDEDPGLTVGGVLEDLQCLRNCVAHGKRVPERFFETGRLSFGEEIPMCDVLTEAASFIVRSSLIRILSDNLLDHFRDAHTANSYFALHGTPLAHSPGSGERRR